jgi:hypothetical protein
MKFVMKSAIRFALMPTVLAMTFGVGLRSTNSQTIELDNPDNTDLPEVVAIAQDLVNDLATSNVAAAVQLFDTDSVTNVTQASLLQIWEDIVAESGPLQRQVAAQVDLSDSVDDPSLVIITSEFENECRDLFILMDQDYEVVGLDVAPGEPLETCQLPQ